MNNPNNFRPVRRPQQSGNKGYGTAVGAVNKRRNKKSKLPVFLCLALIFAILLATVVIRSIGRTPEKNDQKKSDKQTVSVIKETTPVDEFVSLMEPFEYTDETLPFSKDFTFTNAILIDLENETVLASLSAEEKIYPASLTKIMTLIVATENLTDLDAKFEMTAEITDPLVIEEASVAGFAPGELVSVRDMLYGLMLPSGADAAIGLALTVAGSEEEFAIMMNEKAAELGLKGTHFTNASGLHDDDHYSTCHEIALMLRYAMKDELMRKILMTYQYTTAETEQNPEGILLTDTMFSRMYGNEPDSAFILGGKTGYTIEAKNCLASFAVRCEEGEPEDVTYSREPDMLLVTVGSRNKWGPVYDAIDIYSTFAAAEPELDDIVTPNR